MGKLKLWRWSGPQNDRIGNVVKKYNPYSPSDLNQVNEAAVNEAALNSGGTMQSITMQSSQFLSVNVTIHTMRSRNVHHSTHIMW